MRWCLASCRPESAPKRPGASCWARTPPDAVVEFHNSNGRHGGAPQTGLATIALATRSVPWLKDLFADGFVTYPSQAGPRQAGLPATSPAAGGRIAVEMPTVAVELVPLAMERVA